MRRLIGLVATCAVALTVVPSAQQANALQAAVGALGAANVRSLQITAAGRAFSVGQPPTANEPWPPVELRSYVANINLEGNPHNEQALIVWLPTEKILFQSDMGNPPAPSAQLPPASPSLTNYDETLRRLNIQPEKIAGGHGNRVMTPADHNGLMGRATTTN